MNDDGQTHKSCKDRLTLGLVGVGRWGSCYLSTLKAMDDIDLGLVVSCNPATREQVPPGCEVIEDWHEALEPGRVDGLILATPPAVHYEMARACVDSGLPVLVEKPLTENLQQAHDLQQAATQKDSMVMVGHTHLFSSAFEALKQRACSLEGPLRIRSVGGNQGPFRETANPLWDWGAHDISMCLDLIGQSPATIHAHASAAQKKADGEGIIVDVQIEFSNGAHADLKFGNLMSEKKRVFEVHGDNGGLIYDDLAMDKLVEYDRKGIRKKVGISSVPPLTRAVIAFRDCIASGNRQHTSLPLGVRVVETLAYIESELRVLSGSKSNAV